MLFSKKENTLVAVANGRSLPLSEVPDEAFATGLLGIGFAVEPADGTVYSPVTGRIESIADSLHAYTLLSDDGLDVLVHIGIDTVELKGEGFLSMVAVGDRVKVGDVIARVDLNRLRGGNYPSFIPVLITNPEGVSMEKLRTGSTVGGETPVFQYRIKRS
ncbi:MAG: PTS glucose transporter subunit IIA [Clostridia bacterium]|nr:PTS glucose transporter subunit IIA [Clostridia bacterium]